MSVIQFDLYCYHYIKDIQIGRYYKLHLSSNNQLYYVPLLECKEPPSGSKYFRYNDNKVYIIPHGTLKHTDQAYIDVITYLLRMV